MLTPEYEPPAFDYSNGLCYIPPHTASMVYGHGVGLFYWGRGVSVYGSLCNATYFASQHYEYPFRPPYTTYIGEGGTDTLECWYSLTSSCVSVYSCFIALGANEIWNNFITVHTIKPPLADEFTPSMAHFAIYAIQTTPIAVSASAIQLILIADDTLAYACFVRVWLRMYGVTFLALLGKCMRVGPPPVRLTWQLTPRMDYMLLSTLPWIASFD
eukprot:6211792-Pleurochrysis_carterae.AAC.1